MATPGGHVLPQDVKDFFLNVRKGNVGQVKNYVRGESRRIKVQDSWGNTPLYLAILCGHTHVAEYLLQNGARYEASSIEGQRCFLASLNNEMRDMLRKYNGVSEPEPAAGKSEYQDFLAWLFKYRPDTDLQIIARGYLTAAHKFIFLSRCKHLDRAWIESCGPATPVDIPSVTAEETEPLLEFLYTGQGTFSNIFSKTAESLGLTDLSKHLDSKSDTTGDVDIRGKGHLKTVQADFKELALQCMPPPIAMQLSGDDGSEAAVDGPQGELHADLAFNVQGQQFMTHKVFFIGQSEFFRWMLVDHFSEVAPPAFEGYKPSITMDDFSPQVFGTIMLYLYSGSCPIRPEFVIDLLLAADKCALSGLKKLCASEVTNHLTPDTVVQCWKLASTDKDLRKLQDNCVKIMADNITVMATRQDFKDLLVQQATETGALTEIGGELEIVNDIVYYIRSEAHGYGAMHQANESVSVLNRALSEVGLPPVVSRMDTGAPARTRGVYTPPKRRKDSDSCNIL